MARKKASSARGSKPARHGKSQTASYPTPGESSFVKEGLPLAVKRTRKNMDMDQAKLDVARRFFGARTETEAVNAALDLAAFQSEVEAGIDKMVKAGGVSSAVDATCRLPSSMT
jgi:hypothetical protein